MRLTASAMWSPVRSWRTMIVRMSASAAASMIGLTGYPMRNFTPSRLRISATAAAAFMSLSWDRIARAGARDRLILRQTRRTGGGYSRAGRRGAGAPPAEARLGIEENVVHDPGRAEAACQRGDRASRR